MRGRAEEAISNHKVEEDIKNALLPENNYGFESFIFRNHEHIFYVLSMGVKTWVYDLSTALWHERETRGYNRWCASHGIYIFNKNLVADCLKGVLYEMDEGFYDDAGTCIDREIVTPFLLDPNNERFKIHSFFVDFEGGIGLSNGYGDNPQIVLNYSWDSGRTWSDDRAKPLGARGRTEQRTEWRRLGYGRRVMFRLKTDAPVKFSGLYARANAERMDG